MLKDGTYKIKHHDQRNLEGTVIGSFEVHENAIRKREGLAEETLDDGPVTPRVEFQVRRLTNGYNFVEWERPVARPEPKKHGRTQALISST